MSLQPIVISFYTENTPYQLEVMRLIESCARFNIESDIVGIPSQGSWDRNCAMKPFFIRDKLQEHKRPVFWVDADAEFKKQPDFSSMLTADMGLREMKRFSVDPRFKFCAGSLFFNNTQPSLDFLDAWCKQCEEKLKSNHKLDFLDQLSLTELIDQGFPLRVCPLPIAYSKVFDFDALEVDLEEIVVEHFQASRRFRYWGAEQ